MKYVKAMAAIVGMICLNVILEIFVFGYGYGTSNTFGWMFRQCMYLFAMVAVWRKIAMGKKFFWENEDQKQDSAMQDNPESAERHNEPEIVSIEQGGPDTDAHNPTVKAVNLCPACSAENPVDASFCESCGSEFYRDCPECGRKNRMNKKYCISCGTDIDGFLAAKEMLWQMEYLSHKEKFYQVIEESKKVSPEVRLPGSKGFKIRNKIVLLSQEAHEILTEIPEIEEQIESLCATAREEAGQSKRSIPSASTDEQLMQNLIALERRKPLPPELQALKKAIRERLDASARASRRRGLVLGIGIVVLGVLWANADFWLLPLRACRHEIFNQRAMQRM